MFTGLIETVGVLSAAEDTTLRRLTVHSDLPQSSIAIGDSIALDGCCLTVVACGPGSLVFEAATETLRRTTLVDWQVGQQINMERALRVGDRLGGHWVAGHVDTVGILETIDIDGSAWYLHVRVLDDMARLIAPRGSITVSGVSLTVTDVVDDVFVVAIIPHTLQHTNLKHLQVGQRVNIEADLIARYVERLTQWKS